MKQHQIRIQDARQPLLVSIVKSRSINRETNLPEVKEQTIRLIPELCAITGKIFEN
jgi:hypothetical protein